MTRVTVTGATSLVGEFLLSTLATHGARIRAISRSPDVDPLLIAPGKQLEWLQADLENTTLGFEKEEVLLHVAPIWTLPPLLRQAPHPPKRLIAFSSTSHFTKRDSANDEERELAQRLAESEYETISLAQDLGVAWTLFRPTLIYGTGRDKNISQIAAFIQRFGFFPVLGEARGKRMPVHAADLATACLEALKHPQTQGQAYNVPGGEVLDYRAMVERIFHALGRKPRIITIPRNAFSLAIKLANRIPKYSELKPEMAERMNTDLVFEPDKAEADFGYHAREFLPTPDDLLSD